MMLTARNPQKAVNTLIKRLQKQQQHLDAEWKQMLQDILRRLAEFRERFHHAKEDSEKINSKYYEIENTIFNLLECCQHESDGKEKEKMKQKIYNLKNLMEDYKASGSSVDVKIEDSAGEVSEDWAKLGVEEKLYKSLESALEGLQGSYENLDRHDMRLCFLYLCIFPEDAIIKRRPLIYWWISEGLIEDAPDTSRTAEEVGEEIFQMLIEAGLIKPHPYVPGQPTTVVNACQVHPWIRHMLISLAKAAQVFDFSPSGMPCFVSAKAAPSDMPSNDASTTFPHRREWLFLSGERSPKEARLSTVYNLTEKYLRFEPEWHLKLKKATVLQLGRWRNPSAKEDSSKHHIEVLSEKFLTNMAALKFLKYLSLRGISLITQLPESITQFSKLEILDLKACHNLEKLPSDVSPLKKLTHLDMSECPLIDTMPKGLEKLSSLQVLKGFMIGNSKQTPCKILDLNKLKKLRRLGVYIGIEAEVKKGDLDALEQISSLRRLSISWGVKGDKSSEDPMVNLLLPPDLEKLDLRGLPRKKLPKGVNPTTLSKLKKFYLSGGELGSLDHEDTTPWNVGILRLNYLCIDDKVGPEEIEKKFPHVTYYERDKKKYVKKEGKLEEISTGKDDETGKSQREDTSFTTAENATAAEDEKYKKTKSQPEATSSTTGENAAAAEVDEKDTKTKSQPEGTSSTTGENAAPAEDEKDKSQPEGTSTTTGENAAPAEDEKDKSQPEGTSSPTGENAAAAEEKGTELGDVQKDKDSEVTEGQKDMEKGSSQVEETSPTIVEDENAGKTKFVHQERDEAAPVT